MSHNLCLGRDCNALTEEGIFCPKCDRRYGRRLCNEAFVALLLAGAIGAFWLLAVVGALL